ncbi:hypothetical protein SUGI_0650980 [Cryptomeria japonica]|nr:hypothetical protein SUGI_0650980 [Cryptomeria japonica]
MSASNSKRTEQMLGNTQDLEDYFLHYRQELPVHAPTATTLRKFTSTSLLHRLMEPQDRTSIWPVPMLSVFGLPETTRA